MLSLLLLLLLLVLGTFRSEDEDYYEYEFPVLSTRTSKNVGLQTLCACSVRKTRIVCSVQNERMSSTGKGKILDKGHPGKNELTNEGGDRCRKAATKLKV